MAMQRHVRVLDTSAGPYSAGGLGMAGIKVAFATTDLKHVDQHFGSAERFALYRVEPGESALLEVAEFGKLDQDGNEGKLLEKFALLDGCTAMYCQAVGASAIRQLLSLGVQPLKVREGTAIGTLLEELQRELRDGPTGWLARAWERSRPKDEGRFDAMEAEGWDE